LLQEHILRIGQEVVYSKGSEIIGLFNQIEVTAKQIDRVCNYYGGLLHQSELHQEEPPATERTKNLLTEAQIAKDKLKVKIKISSSYEHLRSLCRPGKDLSGDILYTMMDGSYLQFRNQDNSHKDLWKEIKMGRIFFASHQVKEISKKRNIIRYSDYVTSMGNVKPFLEKMEARLDDYKGTMVFINDGASWIWKWVEDAYPRAVQILDYFHAMEYLTGFANAHYADPVQKKEWVKTMQELLDKDQVEKVIEAHRKIKNTGKPIKGEPKEKLNDLLSYYENNKTRMLYGTYRNKGYLVGSGPIESANRDVIQKRLKLSGQRWTEQGAQNMACLRAFMKSTRLDSIKELIKAA
jgi:hypothetical protein